MSVLESPAKNWSAHNGGQDDPRYNTCSPNLVAIRTEMAARWGLTNLGCYGERNIRAGQKPSAHSHGAAIDLRYLEQIGRDRFVNEVIPWLIDNSAELHIGAIHDYVGGRIWHAWRTPDPDDAHTAWWKPQTASAQTGMGQEWAGWVHLETTEDGWPDATPVAARLHSVTTPPPPPPPLEENDDDMHITIFTVRGSLAVFLAETTPSGVALNVRWSGPGSPRIDAMLATHRAKGAKDVTIDVQDLSNTFLLGPLPVGDTRVWTYADFAG